MLWSLLTIYEVLQWLFTDIYQYHSYTMTLSDSKAGSLVHSKPRLVPHSTIRPREKLHPHEIYGSGGGSLLVGGADKRATVVA